MADPENKPAYEGFEQVARPLMEWLAKHAPRDAGVIVTSTHAELLSSLKTFQTADYLKKGTK